ncbi:TPA: hypothetical protein ACOTG0_002713 [Clostridium perfringens]
MDFKNVYLKNLHERDIHPFLVRYLAKKLNVYSKTIYHESSTKGNKGKNEWLHPDVVGFNLPVENWSEKVLELCGNFSINRATVYSFELKKTITLESLREQFFQAVSNSSWANEGYLVGVDIDVKNLELIQEINRLSSAFGIGVIKLNLNNCEESEILFPAKRKNELEGETMNRLFTINNDFRDFVQAVLDSIKINHPVADKFDTVLPKSGLKEIIETAISPINNSYADIDDSNNTTIKNTYLGLDSIFTGQSPIELCIGDTKFQVNNWKDLYIQACNYLIDLDPNLFISATEKVRGKKRIYFSKNRSDVFKAHLLEKVGLYAEVNFSANAIIRTIRHLLKEYKIDESNILISIEN